MLLSIIYVCKQKKKQQQWQQQPYSKSNGSMPCDIFQTTMKTKLMILYIFSFLSMQMHTFFRGSIYSLTGVLLLFFFMMAVNVFGVERVIYVLFPAFFMNFDRKKYTTKKAKKTKYTHLHSRSAYKCKLARWNYQIAWLQSKLMQGNTKNRIPAIECHIQQSPLFANHIKFLFLSSFFWKK